jgi:Glycosyl transferase family 2
MKAEGRSWASVTGAAGSNGRRPNGAPAGRDEAIDSAAIEAFTAQHGERAAHLPPVAIVIAAFNEEGVLGSVVGGLPPSLCGLATSVIVVSDGSRDGTVAEGSAHGALVCDVPVNRGQGAALRLGYRLARHGGARYIVTTDADGQYNPAEMERILDPVIVGEADFVTGSRALGSEETKDPVRRLGVRVFALAISVLTGQRVTDPSFGLRAMRAEVTGAVQLQQPQYQSAELLIAVLARGFRVAEVPATIHKRTVGQSKKGHNALYGLHFAGVIARTWWRERQRRAPRSATGAPPPGGSAGSADHVADPLARAEPIASATRAGSAPPADDGSPASGDRPTGAAAPADPRSAKRT